MPPGDPHERAAEVALLLAPGQVVDLGVAGGACARARVKLLAQDNVVVSARAGRLAAGGGATARVRHDGRIAVLDLAVEEVEPTIGHHVDGLLRVCAIRWLPARLERPPVVLDQGGTVLTSGEVERGVELRPQPMRVVEASDRHLAYISDRRRDVGDRLDLRFSDGVGGEIRCRVTVAEVETLLRRRTRHACELTAIADGDARRLQALQNRVSLAGDGSLRSAS